MGSSKYKEKKKIFKKIIRYQSDIESSIDIKKDLEENILDGKMVLLRKIFMKLSLM